MRYLLAILKNETKEDHLEWVSACKKFKDKVDFDVIDLTSNNWFEKITARDYHCFLVRPPGAVGYFKQLYDERLYILNKVLGKMIYPTYEECLIYENKRILAYWLEAYKIPHPRTNIFYNKEETLAFVQNCELPLVSKTAIGAGGSGVKIHHSLKDVKEYIDKVFSGEGIIRKWGPNLRKGDYLSRIKHRVLHPLESYYYFKQKYKRSTADPQKGYVIFQEYVACEYEWRCVRIGDSFFGHKKLRKRGELFSGTSAVSWDVPSKDLLNFVKEVTDRFGFLSQAIDIFEPTPGKYLVNEMQCFWGSKNPHQMILNGKPGRFIERENQWLFEEGNFNTNNSHDLRLEHVLQLIQNTE